jgi:uncharacterized protein
VIALDTSVLVYSVGDEHPLRGPSRRVVEAIAAGKIRATTTIEVVQEFAHVRASAARVQTRPRSRGGLPTFSAPSYRFVSADLDRGLELFQKHERLGAFDSLLAAAALRTRADGLISGDAAFEAVPGLRYLGLGMPELDELLV